MNDPEAERGGRQGIRSAALTMARAGGLRRRKGGRGSLGRRLTSTSGGWVHGLVATVIVLAVWEIGARIVGNPLFLPPVSAVVGQALVGLARSGELWQHVEVSAIEFALGYAIASGLGIAIGCLMARYRTFGAFFAPIVSAGYATPIIALGPVFILWFGLGITSKVWVVVITAIFPVIINTEAGLTTADPNLIEAVRSFGASELQILSKVRLPSSLPYIVAGERLAVARALIGVVVAEFFGARAGLGYLIFTSAQTFTTTTLFGAVLIFAIAGVVAAQALSWVERKLAPWRTEGG